MKQNKGINIELRFPIRLNTFFYGILRRKLIISDFESIISVRTSRYNLAIDSNGLHRAGVAFDGKEAEVMRSGKNFGMGVLLVGPRRFFIKWCSGSTGDNHRHSVGRLRTFVNVVVSCNHGRGAVFSEQRHYDVLSEANGSFVRPALAVEAPMSAGGPCRVVVEEEDKFRFRAGQGLLEPFRQFASRVPIHAAVDADEKHGPDLL